MTKPSLVAIVIVNWNNARDTIECLNSLSNLIYPNYKIIVVDNGSEDGSPEKIRGTFPNIDMINFIDNKGYGAGCNGGLRHAFEQLGAMYCLILNNDTAIEDKYFLDYLVDSIQRDASVGIVGPLVRDYSPPHDIQSAGIRINLYIGNSQLITRLNPKPIWTEAVHGCAFLIPKEVFEKVGLFDENFFLYWEEIDYFIRVRQAGYRILVNPDISILHKICASSGRQTALYIYYFFRNRLLLMQKHAKPIHWVVLLPLLPLYTLIHLWKSFRRGNNPLMSARAIWQACIDFNKGAFARRWG